MTGCAWGTISFLSYECELKQLLTSIKPQNIIVDVIPTKTHRLPIPSPRGTIRSEPSAIIAVLPKPVTIKTGCSALLYLAATIFIEKQRGTVAIEVDRTSSAQSWRQSVPPSSSVPTKPAEQEYHHYDDQERIRIHGPTLLKFRGAVKWNTYVDR